MVTAGVYMVGTDECDLSARAIRLDVVAVVGAVTAIFAASIALVQNDIKRFWRIDHQPAWLHVPGAGRWRHLLRAFFT